MKNSLVLAGIAVLAVACSPNKQSTHLPPSIDSTIGIVGGEAVDSTDNIAKATVGVASLSDGVFCSGTLISRNLVVTAAHCTGVTGNPREMVIAFAPYTDKATTRKVLGGKVTKEWPELDFNLNEDWGDIAILRFEGDLPEGFAPATLLSPKTAAGALKAGIDVQLAGYGVTGMSPQPVNPKKLLKATVKLSGLVGKTELKFEQYQGKGACHGDSGGPAYISLNGKLALIGVTSRSATIQGGYTCEEGSIYTSVPAKAEFIIEAARYLNSVEFIPGQTIPQPKGF